MTSQPVLPAPSLWRVGIRIKTFEACSGFTRVAARKIAQLPKATFVTRLRSNQLPGQTARQLPDPSTLIRVNLPPQRNAPAGRTRELRFFTGDLLVNWVRISPTFGPTSGIKPAMREDVNACGARLFDEPGKRGPEALARQR